MFSEQELNRHHPSFTADEESPLNVNYLKGLVVHFDAAVFSTILLRTYLCIFYFIIFGGLTDVSESLQSVRQNCGCSFFNSNNL